MEITYSCCAGIDVHKKLVVASCLWSTENGKLTKETRSFGTTTQELLLLSSWLSSLGITHVAMESTGEYWKPIYNILESSFEVMVVNAQHIKNVPGRKTDVKDAEWIAELLRHGLLTGSFIPPLPQRDLRDLTRQRTNLVRERAQHLTHLDFLEEQIAVFDQQIAQLIDAQAACEPSCDPSHSGCEANHPRCRSSNG
jgi:transposase